MTADTYQDFFDTSVLIVLGTSGLIPVSLGLALITRYGRQSWYLLILSWIAVLLASATLITCYHLMHKYGNDRAAYDNNLGYLWDTDNNYGALNSCNLNNTYLGDTVTPLCGNDDLYGNTLSEGIVANWWSWLVWANCIVWMLFCLAKKCYKTKRLSIIRHKTRAFVGRTAWISFLRSEGRAHKIWILIFLIPWLLCFASQFYVFGAYFEHRVISYQWSFGQIIAIFVWVPCIVEYIYIEISESPVIQTCRFAADDFISDGIQRASAYRYPRGLMVVRHLTRSTFSLAKVASPEVQKDEEPDWSPEIQREEIPVKTFHTRYSPLDQSRHL